MEVDGDDDDDDDDGSESGGSNDDQGDVLEQENELNEQVSLTNLTFMCLTYINW